MAVTVVYIEAPSTRKTPALMTEQLSINTFSNILMVES